MSAAGLRIITVTEDDFRRIIQEELAKIVPPAPQRPPDRFLSVAEAAKRAGCSRDTIRAWIAAGRLTEYRAGAGRGHFRGVRVESPRARRPADTPAPVDPEAEVVSMLNRRR